MIDSRMAFDRPSVAKRGAYSTRRGRMLVKYVVDYVSYGSCSRLSSWLALALSSSSLSSFVARLLLTFNFRAVQIVTKASNEKAITAVDLPLVAPPCISICHCTISTLRNVTQLAVAFWTLTFSGIGTQVTSPAWLTVPLCTQCHICRITISTSRNSDTGTFD